LQACGPQEVQLLLNLHLGDHPTLQVRTATLCCLKGVPLLVLPGWLVVRLHRLALFLASSLDLTVVVVDLRLFRGKREKRLLRTWAFGWLVLSEVNIEELLAEIEIL